MDPVIVIQNDEPDENENSEYDNDFAFMLGTLAASVETLTARVDALETANAVTAVVADAALDTASDAVDAAQEAANVAQEAADAVDAVTDALEDDATADDEFMPALVLEDPTPDVPAEKPHPLFRSWNDWKA